jgi:hypothetical protein
VACTMRRAQVGRGALPPSARLDVRALATRTPPRYHGPATRWSRAALVAALAPQRTWTMSRASLWRLLDEADRKPHRRVSGLHRHAPDCEATAHALCTLSLHTLRFCAPGRVVIGSDAKPGRQILQRTDPTQPRAPGKPEKREHESIRHGGRALIASFVVATGQVVWHLGQTRTSADCAGPLAHGGHPRPEMQRYDWGVENLQTHGSLEVCRLVAQWCGVPRVAKARRRGAQRRAFLSDPTPTHGFHLPPPHGAGLHQVAWWLSVVARRFLKRGDCDAAQACATCVSDSLEVSNTPHAHPYRWTYTGQPLVRATPFSHTRRQQRHGRAWLRAPPKPLARAFYPPRP